MNNTATMPHQGRNVKRIREMLGIKQDALAFDLDISQQAVSQLEQKETLDAPMLEKVAKVLGVPEEAIKNFSEEAAVNFVANTFTSNDTSIGSIAHQYNFNPIEKIVELYERMLQAEKEKTSCYRSCWIKNKDAHKFVNEKAAQERLFRLGCLCNDTLPDFYLSVLSISVKNEMITG